MTDSELDAQLRAMRVPERDADYWDWFPRRVVAEVRAGAPPRPERPAAIRLLSRVAWAGGFAVFAALAAFCVQSPQHCPLRVVVASVESVVRFPADLAQLPQHVSAVMRVDRGLGALVEEQP
jgi:hypothetical protein